MTESISRHIKIGDWCFEVKMVRALKVSEYGLPYTAIANCNINGNSMYVDGLLTKNEEEFTKEDFMVFHKFSQQLGLDSFSYHRYQDGESLTKEVKVSQLKGDDTSNKSDNVISLKDVVNQKTS
ncbi:MAG: hypothetical protein MJK12_02865 [Colwellia sp.]|nr:hypothetical protein [Colwellia sp.]